MLQVGETTATVTVEADTGKAQTETSSIGQVIDTKKIVGIPLNGRFFLDEDSTNYLFDGINLSDMVQNQLTFSPNIDVIQEFKVQTSTFSAEVWLQRGDHHQRRLEVRYQQLPRHGL